MNDKILIKLKAITDSTRLEILSLLSKNGTMCGCKLLEQLNITQGTLSHHMKVLSDADVVSIRKDGKWCHYSLNKEEICEIADFLTGICDDEECHCGCCGKDAD